jgi:crotonobetainyl-CoA:carnitine CoA-transferase CaiB-like acyl-CoA transferase
MEKPLHGVRVLDLTQVEAGPIGCSFLCDLGAEVIRVESTKYWQYITRGQVPRPSKALVENSPQKGGYPGGDPGERPWNRYGKFHSFNRGKLSFTVDLTRPEGRDVLLRLAKVSDVLIDGNAPDVTKKMGVDYAALSQVNPKIIYVGLYGFGSTGPYGGQPSMGPLLGSFIGHDTMRGYPDSAPLTNALTVNADPAAGAMAGLAAVQALIERRVTGKGQYIEVGIGENFLSHLGQFYMDTVFNGRTASTLGNRHPSFIQGCYPCRGEERWVTITIEDDAQWQGFCDALGNPDWTRDERFGDVVSRRRNQDALDELIGEWTRQQDPLEVMNLLQKRGIAAAALLNSPDAYANPHLQARGYFQSVHSPEAGTFLFPGPPWHFSESSNAIERPSPALGEHNEYVYKELLGFSDEEYRRYEELGHIGNEPPVA